MEQHNNQNSTLYRNLSITLAILLLLLGFVIYGAQKELKQFKNLAASLNNEITQDGDFIATQHQNILRLKDAVKLGLIEKEKWMKKAKSQQKVRTITQVDSVKIPYEVEKIVYVDSNTFDTSFFVKTPIPINYNDTWNFFSGRVLKDGFMIDSMGSINKYRITIASKKQGFFKKPIPIVEVKNENPKTRVNEISNVQIEDKKPFYQRWLFAFGLGGLLFLLL